MIVTIQLRTAIYSFISQGHNKTKKLWRTRSCHLENNRKEKRFFLLKSQIIQERRGICTGKRVLLSSRLSPKKEKKKGINIIGEGDYIVGGR